MIADNRQLYYVYAGDPQTYWARTLVYAESEDDAKQKYLNWELIEYDEVYRIERCYDDVFGLD